MIRKCLQIREDFELYKRLLEKDKFIEERAIDLVDNGATWRRQNASINHDSHEDMFFGVDKQKFGNKYGLKIFIKILFDEPVFYFDSDGPAHFNYDKVNGLSGSSIGTPHFNFYDSEGIKQARRTEFIEENISRLQNDINFGMEYFCKEAHINTNSHVPRIREGLQLGIFANEIDDIHRGVDFLDEI